MPTNSILDYTVFPGSFLTASEIEKMIVSSIGPDENCIVFDGNTPRQKIIIFEHNLSKKSKDLFSIVQNLKDTIKNGNQTVSIVISETLKDINQIYPTILTLKRQLHKFCELGKSKIISQNDTELQSAGKVSLSSEDVSNITALIQRKQKSLLRTELKKLILTWEGQNIPFTSLSGLLKHLLLICQNACPYQERKHYDDIDSAVDEILSYCSSYQSLIEELWDILDEMFYGQPDLESTDDLVQRVESYIKENITSTFDLKSLSSMVGLTSPYLSKLFKKYRGLPLVEYIIYLKIEKAKQMIEADPEILLREVSDYLGYSDQFYFSRVFKKIVGLSPMDYKNTRQRPTQPY